MVRQEADPLGAKKVLTWPTIYSGRVVLIKMINRHILQLEKYYTNNRDIIWATINVTY